MKALGQEEEIEQVLGDNNEEEVIVQRVRRANSVEQPAKSQNNVVEGLSSQGLEVEYEDMQNMKTKSSSALTVGNKFRILMIVCASSARTLKTLNWKDWG